MSSNYRNDINDNESGSEISEITDSGIWASGVGNSGGEGRWKVGLGWRESNQAAGGSG